MNCKRSWNQGISNPMYGRKHSQETIEKMRQKALAENNPIWAGDAITYNPLHQWVKRRLSKPPKCEICLNAEPLDLANISGTYTRDLKDWRWLCRRCHMLVDGRLARFALIGLKQRQKNGRYWGKNKRAM